MKVYSRDKSLDGIDIHVYSIRPISMFSRFSQVKPFKLELWIVRKIIKIDGMKMILASLFIMKPTNITCNYFI